MQNQTGNMAEHHNETVSLMGHAEGHASIFLPKALVLTTRERPILCLLLMLGTLWLGYTLYIIKRGYVHLLDDFIKLFQNIYSKKWHKYIKLGEKKTIYIPGVRQKVTNHLQWFSLFRCNNVIHEVDKSVYFHVWLLGCHFSFPSQLSLRDMAYFSS